MLLYMIIGFVVSMLFTFFLMPHVLRFCKEKHLYDMPNARKIHHCAIPRLGGTLFMPAMLVGMIPSLMAYIFVSSESKLMQISSFVLIAGVFIIYNRSDRRYNRCASKPQVSCSDHSRLFFPRMWVVSQQSLWSFRHIRHTCIRKLSSHSIPCSCGG